MFQLHHIQPKKGSTKRQKPRLGRGDGSGHGNFSGRGTKGQNQRAGGTRRPGFEGGQTPIIRRVPKLKGFRHHSQVIFQVINLEQLNIFKDGEEITAENLLAKKLIRKATLPVKILGMGKLTKKLSIKIPKISRTAREKIIKAGGKVL